MQLALFMPPANAASPPLSFPLGTVTPTATPQSFRVELRVASVHGHVDVVAPADVRHRLRVVATRNRTNEPAAASDLDVGCNYRLQLLPGQYTLHVLDLATGASVATSEQRIEVAADQDPQHDLAVQLHAVTIRAVPRQPGDEVAIGRMRVQHDRADAGVLGGMRLPALPHTGLLAVPVGNQLDLLLPAGRFFAYVLDDSSALEQRDAWNWVQHGKPTRFLVTPGPNAPIEVPVDPPRPDAALR